jgi:hypothetical protein
MPTLQSSTHQPHQLSMRLGAGLATLGALIAVGAIALLIALTGGESASAANGAIHRAQPRAHTRSVAVIPASFKGFFQDPTTHAVQRVRTTTRNGWPTLASVLAPLTPQQRQYVVGLASLSDAELAAAYGTGR